MQCRLVQEKCAQLGDHVVVVGEVLRAGEYEGNKGPGVIYVNGEYREVGEVVEHNGMTASGLVLPYMDGTDRPIGEVVDPNDEVAKGVGMILVDEKWRKAGKIVEDEEVEDW